MAELILGHPSPEHVKTTASYRKGVEDFQNGASVTDNPYMGATDASPWYWSHGWMDTLAALTRATPIIVKKLIDDAALNSLTVEHSPLHGAAPEEKEDGDAKV